MILSDFLSRQRHDDSSQHKIIPISFNMHGIVQSRYYNLGEGNLGRYLVQTRSQAISSGIGLPKVYSIGKGLDLNILQEKQVIKALIPSEVKGTCQIKPRFSQDTADLRIKIKTLVPPLINKPIVKFME